jgi:hypothetical protein
MFQTVCTCTNLFARLTPAALDAIIPNASTLRVVLTGGTAPTKLLRLNAAAQANAMDLAMSVMDKAVALATLAGVLPANIWVPQAVVVNPQAGVIAAAAEVARLNALLAVQEAALTAANLRADVLAAAEATRLRLIAEAEEAERAAAEAAAKILADRDQATRDRAAEIEATRIEALEVKVREAEAKRQVAAARRARLNGNLSQITSALAAMQEDHFVFPPGPIANALAALSGSAANAGTAVAPYEVETSAAAEPSAISEKPKKASKKRKGDSDDEHADVFPLGKRSDKAATPAGQAAVLQVWRDLSSKLVIYKKGYDGYLVREAREDG